MQKAFVTSFLPHHENIRKWKISMKSLVESFSQETKKKIKKNSASFYNSKDVKRFAGGVL